MFAGMTPEQIIQHFRTTSKPTLSLAVALAHCEGLMILMPRCTGRRHFIEAYDRERRIIAMETSQESFMKSIEQVVSSGLLKQGDTMRLTYPYQGPVTKKELDAALGYVKPTAPWGKKGKRVNPGEAYNEAKRKSKRGK